MQGRIAYRAVEAQERTIYLSPIERRATWLDYAITTWSAWIDQQEQRIKAMLTNQSLPTDEPLRAIGNCRREARWLFGSEVDAFLQKLEVAVRDYSANRMAVRKFGLMEPSERQKADGAHRDEAFQQSLKRMTTLRADLSDKTRPYLYVGDIKATRLPR